MPGMMQNSHWLGYTLGGVTAGGLIYYLFTHQTHNQANADGMLRYPACTAPILDGASQPNVHMVAFGLALALSIFEVLPFVRLKGERAHMAAHACSPVWLVLPGLLYP